MTTVANSRETNKQPQLQKQAQYFFDDLFSSILFIVNYLLPINEPATYYTETTLLSEKQKQKLKWEQNSSPITCEQNRIGEMEKEKNTQASKVSCNIA